MKVGGRYAEDHVAHPCVRVEDASFLACLTTLVYQCVHDRPLARRASAGVRRTSESRVSLNPPPSGGRVPSRHCGRVDGVSV